jgi:hypothetical protein
VTIQRVAGGTVEVAGIESDLVERLAARTAKT